MKTVTLLRHPSPGDSESGRRNFIRNITLLGAVSGFGVMAGSAQDPSDLSQFTPI